MMTMIIIVIMTKMMMGKKESSSASDVNGCYVDSMQNAYSDSGHLL